MCPISKDDFLNNMRLQIASKATPAELDGRQFRARPECQRAKVVKTVERALRLRAVARMKRATDTMWMAFQPIVDTSLRRVFAYEALMRNSEDALSLPGAMLSAAERLDCVQDIGRRTRALSAEAFAHAPADTALFVNLHTQDLLDPALYDVRAPLTRIASRVVLEITERASLDSVKDLPARLAQLRHHGFRIAIDDLGAGYAGLSSCVALEPDFVKLDMFLVRNVHECSARQRLIQTIMAICTGMGMRIIAEGVEIAAEYRQLQAFECRLMQGYLFAKPGLPFPAVEPFSSGANRSLRTVDA
jgi:EAL domain-containing protein (putative c-di-GMP-specific phosphodiesterase class I)